MTTVRRNLSQPHEVTAYCTHCGHGAVLDLKALLEAGYGETELVALPLRCTACGKKGHRIVVAGSRYRLGNPSSRSKLS